MKRPDTSLLSCLFFFICAGIVYGQFTARIPAIKMQTGADEAQIGLMLLCIGAGSLTGFLSVGLLLKHVSSRRLLQTSCILLFLALAACGAVTRVPMLYLSAVIFGLSTSFFDVCMNTQALLLELSSRRARMSAMHSCYSIGGVLGAVSGSVAAAAGAGPMTNFLILIALLLPFWAWAGPRLLEDRVTTSSSEQRKGFPLFVAFCGIMALFAYISEGCAAEWGGLFLQTVKAADESTAALCFAAFSAPMACLRLIGDRLRERFGDFPLLLGGAALASAGMALVLLSPRPVLCLAGYACMGIGLAPVVPTVMSRAGSRSDISPSTASAIVSFFGYSGLLIVPPGLGWVAKHMGLQTALTLPLLLCLCLMAGSFVFRRRQR